MQRSASAASNTLSAVAAPPQATGDAGASNALSEAPALLEAMRPRQWTKNGLVLVAFVFSVGLAWRPRDPASWAPLLGAALLAAVALCLLSSAAYLINDLRDLERDRLHPKKRRRPLAAGRLRPVTAATAAIVLLAVGATLAAVIGPRFLLVAGAYVALTFGYSFGLKRVAILDLLLIASGFVLRAIAGAVAIAVPVSPWLYLCTLLGALFLAISKRRHELTLLGDAAAHHRPGLEAYSVALLDQMAGIVTASTVVAYALYTVTADNLPPGGAMLATVPFVLFGIFRYLYLVHRQDSGGSPEDVLLGDRPLQATLILWGSTALAILALTRG